MAKIENKHDIQGRVLYVGMPEEIFSNVYKRMVVVEQENPRSSTPWEVPVEFFNQNMDLIRGINKGDLVYITFQVRGRKKIADDGRARWWPTIEGLMISKVTG